MIAVLSRLGPIGLAVGLLGAGAAWAQVAPNPDASSTQAEPELRQNPVPAQTGPASSDDTSITERDKLLGTIGGVRTGLEQYGIVLGLSETSEVFGNVSGGRRTGAIYEGLTTASLDLDLGKSVGLAGGTVRVSALQIHGRGLSTNNINNLNVTSSIEATRATRLFEFWYQQSFLGGKVDVKLGQQSADFEFATSTYGGLFTNSSFGFPTSFAVDLPAGGPAYPLAALGARLRVKPVEPLTMLLAVFNGSPSGTGEGDPQGRRNPSGTAFRLSDGVFVIGEVQYALNGGDDATGLPGTYKLGGWYNSNSFTNQFFTNAAISAAAPGTIPPGAARGNWSLYGVMDQLVWRKPGSKDGGVGVFFRATGGPGDRNVVNLFLNGGVTYKGPFGRDNDTVGLGVSWARISDTARAGDAAVAAIPGGDFLPVRTSETLIELTYQTQILPSIQVQPVFQYVFNPGGGIVNPDRPDRRIGDAAIFGIRSTITF